MDLAGITAPLCIAVAALVCFALAMEKVIHHCIHKASHDRFWRNFVAALLAELSMLGLISFTLFGISQISFLSSDHIELIEFVHLTLFLMMVLYYVIIGWIALSSKRILNKLGDFEERVENFDLTECVWELRELQELRRKKWFPENPIMVLCGASELHKKTLCNAYLLTRHYFLVSQGLPSTLSLDYAEYVDRCTSALLVKLVQVRWVWVDCMHTGIRRAPTSRMTCTHGLRPNLTPYHKPN